MPNAKLLIAKITGTKSQMVDCLCYHQNPNFKNFRHPSGTEKHALDDLQPVKTQMAITAAPINELQILNIVDEIIQHLI